MDNLNFEKLGGLVPAVIQDARTNQVLMVGFMNAEALKKTLADKKITFWSRTKKRLWQKGETSGNFLEYVSMQTDCDLDSLLMKAIPHGPVCHTNTFTCFGEDETMDVGSVLVRLEETIRQRQQQMPEGSYTSKLFKEGTPRIAQKVGEEGVEVALASVLGDKKRLTEESADLLFHLLVLLRQQELTLADVTGELKRRMK
ncbi:MAG: bifunctional phosphoribosyl-AMP cyclohydrolase/phosphoribosyl-ATP diphosphatase HisIE [Ignavibacteriae bacterium]|nr:MAG: bifunctional phosphoribosyl-AMP cyclohydrolase/phosphoribosyl-ATP diphosphatase HisIE [Ignavibacteriota bacterium]